MKIKKPGNCPDCPEYKNCTELCREAERYVAQDSAGMSSRTWLSGACDFFDGGNEFIDQINNSCGIKWDELLEGNADYDVIEFLERLHAPEQYINVAKLRYLDGRNYQEIGDIIGVSRERVRTIFASGLPKLVMEKLSRRDAWKKISQMDFPVESQRRICELYFDKLYERQEVSAITDFSKVYVGKVIRKYTERYRNIDI